MSCSGKVHTDDGNDNEGEDDDDDDGDDLHCE